MKQLLIIVFTASLLFIACSEQQNDLFNDQKFNSEYTHEITPDVISQITALGFNPDGIEVVEQGYRIERDIIITPEFLTTHEGHDHSKNGNEKQFSTNALVSTNGSRVIAMYISAPGCGATANAVEGSDSGDSAATSSVNEMRGGGKGNGNGGGGSSGGGGGESFQFDQNYADALDDAISRFNAENLEISFVRVCEQSQADISFSRLRKKDERQGVLGSAGFPSGGDPFDRINMSGIIISNFGWSVDALATVMAHEMGHCIGFRHTDFYDRSISCGGQTSNEGTAGIGANHIPGTPNVGQVSASDQSWMLSCTGDINRPFNSSDKVALDFLY